MNRKYRTLPLLTAGVLFCLSGFAPALSEGTEIRNTSTPMVMDEKIGKKTFQISKLLVKARPEKVWSVLSDYEGLQDIFPPLKRSKIVKDGGTVKQVEHEIKPSGVPGTFEYVLEIKETGTRMQEWHRLSGDFKEVDGFWKLEPVDSGNATLVTYGGYVNGGIFIPQQLIRHQFGKDIPSIMLSLKQAAEANTGKIASRKTN